MSGFGLVALIDCDNFFASCERIFRPDLAAKPVIVLSNNDGCVVARSQEAKNLGIAMGIPFFQIKNLVKLEKVTVFSANFGLYGDLSQRLTDLLAQISPRIEVYSIDESFVDLSDLPLTDYQAWAKTLRQRILSEIGVPVSIGIAPTKTLAKAAADFAKKQTNNHIYAANDPKTQSQLLNWLPLGDIWGIGRRLSSKLNSQGISKTNQLLSMPDAWLQQQLTIKGLGTVKELRGQPVVSFEPVKAAQKSIMYTRMFGFKIREIHQLESAVASFTAAAAAKLRAQNLVAPQISVFLKTADNRYVSAWQSLDEPTADNGSLIKAALSAFGVIYDSELAYKKAGVILGGLSSNSAWQLSLTSPDKNRFKKQKLMQAVDQLKRRFGPDSIKQASEQLDRGNTWRSQHRTRSPAYTTSWLELPTIKA